MHIKQNRNFLLLLFFIVHCCLGFPLKFRDIPPMLECWLRRRAGTLYVNSPYKTIRCQQFATITLAARSHSPQSRSPPDLTCHNHACRQISLATIMLAARSHLPQQRPPPDLTCQWQIFGSFAAQLCIVVVLIIQAPMHKFLSCRKVDYVTCSKLLNSLQGVMEKSS